MTLDDLLDLFREYAKDVRLNLSALLGGEEGTPGLTPNQVWGIALSCTYATKSEVLRAALEPLAWEKLSPEAREAARIAATLMAQNNVFYRTMHLLESRDLADRPARLRMNLMNKHGIAKVDFELFCLAVSAQAGCGACINSHVRVLRDAGMSDDGIHSAIRIAAVIQAAAQALWIGNS